jgi:hypothetical protein
MRSKSKKKIKKIYKTFKDFSCVSKGRASHCKTFSKFHTAKIGFTVKGSSPGHTGRTFKGFVVDFFILFLDFGRIWTLFDIFRTFFGSSVKYLCFLECTLCHLLNLSNYRLILLICTDLGQNRQHLVEMSSALLLKVEFLTFFIMKRSLLVGIFSIMQWQYWFLYLIEYDSLQKLFLSLSFIVILLKSFCETRTKRVLKFKGRNLDPRPPLPTYVTEFCQVGDAL